MASLATGKDMSCSFVVDQKYLQDAYELANGMCSGQPLHTKRLQVQELRDAHAEARTRAKISLLQNVRVVLCTVDRAHVAVGELRRTFLDVFGEERKKDIPVPHTVILDEASSMPENSIPVLLTLGPKNLVLVGDDKQLPPFSHISQLGPWSKLWPQEIKGKALPAEYNRSIYERFTHAGVPTHDLSVQYRMHPEICSTVSNMFYGGRLVSATELALNSPKGNALFFWDVSQEEFEVKGRKGRIQNRQEAEAAAVLACDAIHKNPASLVFIICAYAAQRQLVMSLLAIEKENRGWKEEDARHRGLVVMTVDSAQGSEADYVFVCTTRSNSSGNVGFLNDPKRINVSISRAKKAVVILGNRETLESDPQWRRVLRDTTEILSKHGKDSMGGLINAIVK